jgi:hypothetical protein
MISTRGDLAPADRNKSAKKPAPADERFCRVFTLQSPIGAVSAINVPMALRKALA